MKDSILDGITNELEGRKLDLKNLVGFLSSLDWLRFLLLEGALEQNRSSREMFLTSEKTSISNFAVKQAFLFQIAITAATLSFVFILHFSLFTARATIFSIFLLFCYYIVNRYVLETESLLYAIFKKFYLNFLFMLTFTFIAEELLIELLLINLPKVINWYPPQTSEPLSKIMLKVLFVVKEMFKPVLLKFGAEPLSAISVPMLKLACIVIAFGFFVIRRIRVRGRKVHETFIDFYPPDDLIRKG
ncbi:hypothetical protein [Desulfurobacterium sp. TC5-1]|uniref:hypothetical protein n=1 Tax=Desulfurobacterium sp. TC5-1 TaxID=1158318 RepID=UPI0003B53E0B|nr:hypothetical protein [Desulfurobacterium sp. TC5-1]